MNKNELDKLMQEYHYEKNSVEDTMEFIAFMFHRYEKLLEEENEQLYEKYY